MKNAILTSLAALGILLAIPVALGNTYGFTDQVEEDSPLWSCVDDGNHTCGPNNPEGKPAACYDVGGVIVAMWPCHEENIDGEWEVFKD
jgi:hypothetical protein